MSEWRKQALAQFPEHRVAIESAVSAHGVFFELLPALREAYFTIPPDEQSIKRIHAYASWCFALKRHADVRDAALLSFYEHLPEFERAWRDIRRFVSAEDLAVICDHLRGYSSPAMYQWAVEMLEGEQA
jgi:hypothetical protein